MGWLRGRQSQPPSPVYPPPPPNPSPTAAPRLQVGDIDSEMLLWYRPEEQGLPRPAFAVDLSTGGSDLGGSVTAALAAASIIFRNQNESDYAAQLLDKAREVGGWVGGRVGGQVYR